MKLSHVLWLAGTLLVASLFAGIAAPRFLHAAGDPKPGTISVLGVGSSSFGVWTATELWRAAPLGESGVFVVLDVLEVALAPPGAVAVASVSGHQGMSRNDEGVAGQPPDSRGRSARCSHSDHEPG